jgi:hypothetical protein
MPWSALALLCLALACSGPEFSGAVSDAGTDAASGAGGSAADGGAGGVGGVGGASKGCAAPGELHWLFPVGGRPEYPTLAGDYVYFTTKSGVARISVQGGQLEQLHLGGINNAGVAAWGSRVAWADPHAATLYVGDLLSADSPTSYANEPGISEVATDDSTFYWSSADGIRRLAANEPVALYPKLSGIRALAIRDDHLYWVTSSGDLFRAPTSGTGPITKLGSAPSQWSEVRIALDHDHVYFTARISRSTNPDGGMPPDGVWRIPRGGGAAEQIGQVAQAEGVAVSPECIYWGGNDRVYVRDKQLTAGPESIGGFYLVSGLLAVGERLFVTDGSKVLVHPL